MGWGKRRLPGVRVLSWTPGAPDPPGLTAWAGLQGTEASGWAQPSRRLRRFSRSEVPWAAPGTPPAQEKLVGFCGPFSLLNAQSCKCLSVSDASALRTNCAALLPASPVRRLLVPLNLGQTRGRLARPGPARRATAAGQLKVCPNQWWALGPRSRKDSGWAVTLVSWRRPTTPGFLKALVNPLPLQLQELCGFEVQGVAYSLTGRGFDVALGVARLTRSPQARLLLSSPASSVVVRTASGALTHAGCFPVCYRGARWGSTLLFVLLSFYFNICY